MYVPTVVILLFLIFSDLGRALLGAGLAFCSLLLILSVILVVIVSAVALVAQI